MNDDKAGSRVGDGGPTATQSLELVAIDNRGAELVEDVFDKSIGLAWSKARDKLQAKDSQCHAKTSYLRGVTAQPARPERRGAC